MAFTFGTPVTGTKGTTGTTIDLSVTIGAGAGRLLIVGVSWRNVASGTISGVAFDPAGLNVAFSSHTQESNGTNAAAQFWYLVAPPVGTYTVRVTFTESGENGTAVALPIYGAKQASPFGTQAVANGSNTTGTGNQAVSGADTWLAIDLISKRSSAETATARGGQTERGKTATSIGTAAQDIVGGLSTEVMTTTSVNMGWDWSTAGNRQWAFAGIAIEPGLPFVGSGLISGGLAALLASSLYPKVYTRVTNVRFKTKARLESAMDEGLTKKDELVLIRGSSIACQLEWQEATSISSPTTIIKKGNQDLSATWLSGSEGSSGNVQTSRVITPPLGSEGKRFILEWTATVNNNTEKRWTKIVVPRPPQ